MAESDAARRAAPMVHLGHPDGAHIPLIEWPRDPSPLVRHRNIVLIGIVGVGLAFVTAWLERLGDHAPVPDVAWPWVLPFALLLVSMAVLPFVARHFWEKHYHHWALALGAVVAGYYVFGLKVAGGGEGFLAERAGRSIAKSLGEYLSFLFLLGSLFVVSGGILIRVRRRATPSVNALLLLTGAILANVFGTTGAAMLLIRPYLRINKGHVRAYHVAFFIFLVANVGGCLTPIGDPPLFLGYLKGVPFWWVAAHCWPMWAVAVGILLGVFFVWDTVASRGQARERQAEEAGPAMSLYGASNLLLIAAILCGVLVHEPLAQVVALPWRELVMVVAVALSLWSTPQRIHEENVFNFAPIREVAYLFLGIFATMALALNYLAVHAHDPAFERALHTPGQYYYACGGLSSVLDNAPTYLTFLETELAKIAPGADETAMGMLVGDERLNGLLVAISLGAVFFGAMTYIGNGPNFMVKSIAEHDQAPCPSFFGYLLGYALPVLLPVLVVVWLVFLRGG